MCGPRNARVPRPSIIRNPPTSSDPTRTEEQPYYSSYHHDPELHTPANGLNDELKIRKKMAKGFD